jgi:hypothetical protein
MTSTAPISPVCAKPSGCSDPSACGLECAWGAYRPSLRNRAYYLVKPYLPRKVRTALRRVQAERARSRAASSWPIDHSAGHPPIGWPGWPEGKRFAVIMTHDVEGARGVERVPDLADLERQCGFRSSFNFIPEGEYRVSPDLRATLERDGFEVGVHDLHHDGKLYQSDREFPEKAQRINKYLKEWGASGFRSGFMLRNLDWIQDLDILYDASTFDTDPFEPQPVGAGTIFPFFVEGTQGRRGYVELPYTLVQDSTLFLLLCERSIDIWKSKVDWIVERGGMVLLNLHPDYLTFGDGQPDAGTFAARHYAELLTYIGNRYAGQYWAPLPRDLAQWYAAWHQSSSRNGRRLKGSVRG